MLRVIAIGGEPGSGKTTLMRHVMKDLGFDSPIHEEVKMVPFHQKANLFVLGKYEEEGVFAGTDRMSMAVQPEAVKFLATMPEKAVVLFEGDRLFNQSFLEHCNENYDLKIVGLLTDKAEKAKRYQSRGSNQDPFWLKGRETKVQTILSNLGLMFVTEKFENNTFDDQKVILDHIYNLVR